MLEEILAVVGSLDIVTALVTIGAILLVKLLTKLPLGVKAFLVKLIDRTDKELEKPDVVVVEEVKEEKDDNSVV